MTIHGPLIPPSLGQHAESQLPGLVLERDRDVERCEQVAEEPFVVLVTTGGPVLASRLAPPDSRVSHRHERQDQALRAQIQMRTGS